MALHLTQDAEPAGAHLENLVLNDLAWRDARLHRAEILHWRTTIGEEVDFVTEAGDRLLPIEVKATTRPRVRDVRHLLTFRSEYGDKARAGLLLHTGTTIEWMRQAYWPSPGGRCSEGTGRRNTCRGRLLLGSRTSRCHLELLWVVKVRNARGVVRTWCCVRHAAVREQGTSSGVAAPSRNVGKPVTTTELLARRLLAIRHSQILIRHSQILKRGTTSNRWIVRYSTAVLVVQSMWSVGGLTTRYGGPA